MKFVDEALITVQAGKGASGELVIYGGVKLIILNQILLFHQNV